MKQQFSKIASLAVLALACTLSMISCGGEDDEPSIDDILSTKTTPVTFRLDNGNYKVFDYAGGRYIGSDTLEVLGSTYHSDEKAYYKNVSIDLRQGQHQVLLFSGISKNGAKFDPATKCVTASPSQAIGNVMFSSCDINVTEFISPAFNLIFKPLTTRVAIYLYGNVIAEATNKSKGSVVAKIDGLPFVTSVSVADGKYDSSGSANFKTNLTKNYCLCESSKILCPKDGMDGVQMTVELTDQAGNHLTTIALPSISLRCGQVTIVGGEASSSSDKLETVMVPYAEFNEFVK